MILLGMLIGLAISYLTIGVAVAVVDVGLTPELYVAWDDPVLALVVTAAIWPAVLLDWLARTKP